MELVVLDMQAVTVPVALAVLAAAEPEKIRAEMVLRAPLIQAVAVVAVVTRLIIQIPLLAAGGVGGSGIAIIRKAKN